MFDFGAINKSAEAMAQAATDIVSRLESIENLTREQNALLGTLVLASSSDSLTQQATNLADTAWQRWLRWRRDTP